MKLPSKFLDKDGHSIHDKHIHLKGYEYDSEKHKINDFKSLDSKNHSAIKRKSDGQQMSQSGNWEINRPNQSQSANPDALSEDLGYETPGMFKPEAKKNRAKISRSIGEINTNTGQNLLNPDQATRKSSREAKNDTLIIPRGSCNLPKSQNSANNLADGFKKTSILTRVPGLITNFFGSNRNSKNIDADVLSQKMASVRSIDLVSPKRKFVRCVHAAIFVVKLKTILEQVKIFGTTSNLFNLTFRPPDSVYKSLKPPSADQEKKDPIKLYLKRWQINPMGYTTAAWNILMFFLIIYCVTFMPYGMVFYPESEDKEMAEEIMNIFFGIDIIVNFLTPIYKPDGEIMFEYKDIADNYFKGFFTIDFISSVPFGLMTGGGGGANKLLRIMKIPRLIKMMKLTKV